MPPVLDHTHDLHLKSWVESANNPATDFPIQNLPYCVFVHNEDADMSQIGVRIGDCILDLDACARGGLFHGVHLDDPDEGLAYDLVWHNLNELMAASPSRRSAVRQRISELLREDTPALRDNPYLCDLALLPLGSVTLIDPSEIGDYTDFYASVHHATNVGSMFRPDNPILPNYKHLPVGYHGRSSTVSVYGESIVRPWGQKAPAEEGSAPKFEPSKLLDYELEVGFFVAQGNEPGEPIEITEAEDHIFGMCLLNDWSARDIQKWEYQPLGPFLAKNFATTISPYIVTLDALAPFRCATFTRPEGDPTPLPHLHSQENEQFGGVDITLEVFLASAQMREKGMDPVRLSKGSFKEMYWTIAQMLTHHASSGCEMVPGDLLGSGTVSGPSRDSRGCLLELTWDGDANNPVPGTQRTPIELPTGEKRVFLEDGDEVILKGYCEREGYRRIGFGECRGTIAPAISR